MVTDKIFQEKGDSQVFTRSWYIRNTSVIPLKWEYIRTGSDTNEIYENACKYLYILWGGI